MKTHSTLGYIILILGIMLFSNGLSRLSGSFGYSSLIPNKSVALLYISIGLSVMFISYFIKPQKNQ
ncbi:hypothetical protein C7Y47_18855 [Lysinibacillus sphaericus]|uniref:DUF3955 domain-containing protein n=1 Tax=Lysinibacillus sphaericus TaxID=1421 RepID=A0A544U9W1_LYSSH|nr:hypothetical protein C7Y47_18855 [Lysinibacillus sp. SDF0037]